MACFMLGLLASLMVTSCVVRGDVNAHSSDSSNCVTMEAMQELTDKIDHLSKRMTSMEAERKKTAMQRDVKRYKYNDETQTVFSAYGCFLDTLTLSCPDNRTILITGGDYGQFSYACRECDISCTPAHPDDCTESMQDSAPQDLVAIKLLCDNQTSCEFINQGGALLTCDDPKEINHLTVYYRCLPEPMSGSDTTVAFTAGPLVARSYGSEETVIFDDVFTNVGDAYDPDTSIFTCPVTGLYMFAVSVHHDPGLETQVRIDIEGEAIVNVFASDPSSVPNSASSLGFVQCTQGQRVSVVTHSRSFQSVYNNRYSTFSGMLVAST